jgi:multidrug efflux pump subunit AcrA (membrane-fusion protein)
MELAKIGLTELPPGDFDVRKVPTVVRAEALERGATTRFERVQRAHAARATSPEDFDQALTELNMAQAATRQTIMDARATLAAARHKKALLETAEQRLRYTRVQAPNPSQERIGPTQKVEYVVSQRLVSEGEMVRAFPSVPVFKLVIDRPLKFLSTVPERHVGEVKLGQTADIGVEAYPGKTFPGRVSRVNPTVDRANRTFQIEILVENESRALKAGSFAKASLFTHEDPKALTVPDEALVFFAGVTKVFIVRQGKAHAVEVKRGVPLEIKIPVEGTNKPGDNQDDTKRPRAFVWWEVEPLGELPAGSPVITSGQSQLAEGTPVRVRP